MYKILKGREKRVGGVIQPLKKHGARPSFKNLLFRTWGRGRINEILKFT